MPSASQTQEDVDYSEGGVLLGSHRNRLQKISHARKNVGKGILVSLNESSEVMLQTTSASRLSTISSKSQSTTQQASTAVQSNGIATTSEPSTFQGAAMRNGKGKGKMKERSKRVLASSLDRH